VGGARYAEEFKDPYVDFVVSQLLTPKEALRLRRAELQVLMASVRGEILGSAAIREQLRKKVDLVLAEFAAVKKHFPEKR
jgi:hypothetical protein